MYLEEVEAVVETRTVDKSSLRWKIYQICIKISKDVFNRPMKRSYLRSYYTKRSMQLFYNSLFHALSLQVSVMTVISTTNK